MKVIGFPDYADTFWRIVAAVLHLVCQLFFFLKLFNIDIYYRRAWCSFIFPTWLPADSNINNWHQQENNWHVFILLLLFRLPAMVWRRHGVYSYISASKVSKIPLATTDGWIAEDDALLTLCTWQTWKQMITVSCKTASRSRSATARLERRCLFLISHVVRLVFFAL